MASSASPLPATHRRSLAGQGFLVYYVVAVLIWGSEAVLTKAFLLDALTPGAMLALRVLITALVLLPLLALLFGREAAAVAPRLAGQDWFWLLWMGGISSGLAYVFYYKGLQGSNVVIASVVTLLGPVVGVTLSVLLLHERFTAVQVAGIAGLLVTMYFLSTSDLRPARRRDRAGFVTGANKVAPRTLSEDSDNARDRHQLDS